MITISNMQGAEVQMKKNNERCKGSSKEYSFRMLEQKECNSLHIFESSIDLLSYATLLKIRDMIIQIKIFYHLQECINQVLI